MKRGEIWWADLGAYRVQEQTGRRPVIVWQSDTLTRLLQSVLVVPLTTNLEAGGNSACSRLRRWPGDRFRGPRVSNARDSQGVSQDEDSLAVPRGTRGTRLGDRRSGLGESLPQRNWNSRGAVAESRTRQSGPASCRQSHVSRCDATARNDSDHIGPTSHAT